MKSIWGQNETVSDNIYSRFEPFQSGSTEYEEIEIEVTARFVQFRFSVKDTPIVKIKIIKRSSFENWFLLGFLSWNLKNPLWVCLINLFRFLYRWEIAWATKNIIHTGNSWTPWSKKRVESMLVLVEIKSHITNQVQARMIPFQIIFIEVTWSTWFSRRDSVERLITQFI